MLKSSFWRWIFQMKNLRWLEFFKNKIITTFIQGSFIFDQMLFDYPVFRHENYVDLFLYRSRTGWVVGKGLSGQNLAYRASVEGGNCPTWTGQNWQFRSQGDNIWKPSNLRMGCPSFWSNWRKGLIFSLLFSSKLV